MNPGYWALQESAAWLDLPGRGLLVVAGPDRLRFLNAMVTADIRRLNPGEGCYTLFLDERGRVLGDAELYALGDSYLLDTEAGNRDALYAHLDRFLIADDASVEDHSSLYSCGALEGPLAAELLSGFDIPPLDATQSVVEWSGGLVTRATLTGVPGFRLFVRPEAQASLMARLRASHVVAVTEDDARIVRIEHGKPRWGEEITHRYLGPETAIAGAIASSKGCYLGQEVVERIRARGLLDRLLVSVRIGGAGSVVAGDKIFAGERRAGHVASATYSPRWNEVVGLAYIRTAFVDGDSVLTCGIDGAPVTIQHQPRLTDARSDSSAKPRLEVPLYCCDAAYLRGESAK